MDLFNSLPSALLESPPPADGFAPPHLVLNDKTKGLRVLSTIQAELQKCESFRFYVAFVNQAGVVSLLQTLDDVRHAGISGKVLVSQYLNFTSPQALRTLMHFDNIDLRIATQGSVHAKGFFFFRPQIHNYIVGSSNWTHSALSSNTELNLKIQTTPESPIAHEVEVEFDRQFAQAKRVDNDFIETYEEEYQAYQQHMFQSQSPSIPSTAPLPTPTTLFPRQPILQDAPIDAPAQPYSVKKETVILPNRMQKEALANLDLMRLQGKNKALIVSATGTGKTFLSAFDAQALGAQKLLFVVHRENIARAALEAYRLIFGSSRTFGVYSGNAHETSADFIFSTVQTLSRPERLHVFDPDHFDYIIVDESHRTGAASYASFLDYFEPNFLLGMTATPERTDGADIFQHFDHNIAYEIRLQQALEEDMLCPFHYFGVTDLSIQGETVEDTADFIRLIAEERIERIIEKARFYGCDDGIVRGLVFCSRVDEAVELSKGFNERGYRTVALSGNNNEYERETAIERLESDDSAQKLDYIFTVDIFNEGVDIPRVNQIIMLRPTQSAIIFVQQLGRGLRKVDRDKYLTVIDFIGNYQNNYLIPIALYGDRTFDKDQIRRLVVSGNQAIPGTSTINFDRISKEKIFASINLARLHLKKDLRADFTDLNNRLGRIPMMMDFFEHGNRDPRLYVKSAKSYYNFVREEKPDTIRPIAEKAKKLLEVYSKDVLNGRRLEEALILSELLQHREVEISSFLNTLRTNYYLESNPQTVMAACNSLNLRFIREKPNNELVPVGTLLELELISCENGHMRLLPDFDQLLQEAEFERFLRDLMHHSKQAFLNDFDPDQYQDGFVLYRKYTRSDVFRLLRWEENPVAQNVGGYIISQDKTNCPIFVTYHKSEDIATTTQYEDRFLSPSLMEYFSKSRRRLSSPDVQYFQNLNPMQRMPLFVQKNNDEGIEFYYLGNVVPRPSTFVQESMPNSNVPVVKLHLDLDSPVEESLYAYLIDA